jgi:hypothetical protein
VERPQFHASLLQYYCQTARLQTNKQGLSTEPAEFTAVSALAVSQNRDLIDNTVVGVNAVLEANYYSSAKR